MLKSSKQSLLFDKNRPKEIVLKTAISCTSDELAGSSCPSACTAMYQFDFSVVLHSKFVYMVHVDTRARYRNLPSI